MRCCAWVGGLAILLAGAGSSLADPAAAPPAQSPQALYNDAQTAFDNSDWDKAIAGFSAVLAGPPIGGRPEAVIRSRLAEALFDKGRLQESETQARKAIAELDASGPDADLAYAYLTLGDALQADLSYEDAIDAYKNAQAFAAGPDAADTATAAALGIIKSAMVTHPDLAASTADAIIADDAFRSRSSNFRAQVLTLRARAELNRGDPKGARTFVDRALGLVGPMGPRLNLFQVAVRGDAALIYATLHDDDQTRQLLAYTGAGHFQSELWSHSIGVKAPGCTTTISPEDTAVVEFAIADDGRTVAAAPVYASRPGPMGVAFAKTVLAWRWQPEAVAKVDGFWRAGVRVQLRCHQQSPSQPGPSPSDTPAAPSTLEREASDLDAATGETRTLGLDCSHMPGRPAFISGLPSDADFPNEAQRWGFEGVVVEGVDIGAHGEVTGERPLIAYPPLVFVDAAQKMVRFFGYRPPTPAALEAGCNEVAVWVNYQLPPGS
jgi:tetratricopeptide (TPR) repeat protein